MDEVMGSYSLRKNSQENYMTYLNIWLGTDSLHLALVQYRENKKFLSRIGIGKWGTLRIIIPGKTTERQLKMLIKFSVL
jgi:hypothetical protein